MVLRCQLCQQIPFNSLKSIQPQSIILFPFMHIKVFGNVKLLQLYFGHQRYLILKPDPARAAVITHIPLIPNIPLEPFRVVQLHVQVLLILLKSQS
jgi:hypothetical protein